MQSIKSKRTNKKYLKHNFLFKGLIRCSEGSGKITWEERKRIVYGHCNRYRECAQRIWHKEKNVEQKIAERLASHSQKYSLRYNDCTTEEKRRLLRKVCGNMLLGDKIFELTLAKT